VDIETPFYIGNDAISKLAEFCTDRDLKRFFLIADNNTYRVLGKRVEETLNAAGFDMKPVILHDEHVQADPRSIVNVLVQIGDGDGGRYFMSVGSGTLTDITRFVSHRTRSHFISVPTAPSVDGFLSPGSPLVINNLKQTVPGHVPMGIFCDIKTLQEAPPDMIAAGYGDMLGKLTSLTDWKLGHLLWGEHFDEEIYEWAWGVINDTVAKTDQIAQADAEGITILMNTLIESGQMMVSFGNSNPASGTEHHLSHFWEMKMLLGGRIPALHGAKVGIGTIYAVRRYEILRSIDRAQLVDLLEDASLPNPDDEIAAIEANYGPAAESAIKKQQPFLSMTEADFDALKQRILENWDEVHALADKLPASEQVRAYLEAVGGPTETSQIGISPEETQQALDHAHYFRDRFTANKLFHLLSLRLEP